MRERPPSFLVGTALLGLALCGCGPKGQVTLAGPEVTDDAPAEWVAAYTEAMDNNRRHFLECYEEELKSDESVAGTVSVRIEFGAPSIAWVRENTTGSESLGECVAGWSPTKIYLSSPPDGHVTFELEFSPG